MKTFFTVKFALLPIAVFVFLIASGRPAVAIGAGFLVSLIVGAWRLSVRDIKMLEIATVAIFGALTVGLLLFPETVATQAVPLAFIGLGAFSITTVLLRKPWTAEFSRAAYPDAAENPVFVLVNTILSALWGVLFLLLALAHARKAGARRIRSLETYHWPAPAFGSALAGDDFDVVVVGAGIGGLTAAALLADAGHQLSARRDDR
jgi:all-trans-retinol 13,14-reductase